MNAYAKVFGSVGAFKYQAKKTSKSMIDYEEELDHNSKLSEAYVLVSVKKIVFFGLRLHSSSLFLRLNEAPPSLFVRIPGVGVYTPPIVFNDEGNNVRTVNCNYGITRTLYLKHNPSLKQQCPNNRAKRCLNYSYDIQQTTKDRITVTSSTRRYLPGIQADRASGLTNLLDTPHTYSPIVEA
ncbi:hypothetical protein HBI71_219010 [Parastagonospora nodorum]|nr:hypothetical protein HBI71_219010 [Parastagonospora nodorum]KAH6026239.1 hypothetical protein HBI54_242970 [Parastagonospora nodorum]KAH6191393.1 hypothetical protein HBI53_225200 [Parastagonospora nodorum]KAH6518584.1 hypothetical protein HBI07_238060 [Parastagonospora nodorum]